MAKKQEPLRDDSSVRNVEIIAYEDSSNIKEIEEVLKANTNIIKWAYILHDKDDQKPHYHIDINYKETTKCSTIMNAFGVKINQLARPVGTWKSMIKYLTHQNAPEKYQYDVKNVVSNFPYEEEIKTDVERIFDVCNRIIKGEISRKQAYCEIGYPYNPKASKYINDAYKTYCERMEETREMNVTLIFGKAGTGKTSAAKMYAKSVNKDMCISSSSNDPMQDYGGEKVLILDDIREDTFDLSDWLKLLDNNTSSSVKSRYNNKVFTGDEIILTTSVSPVTWFEGTKEERWQFFRRINLVIEVLPDKILLRDKGFKRTKTGYIELMPVSLETPNPVAIYEQLPNNDQERVIKVANAFIKMTLELEEEVKKQEEEQQ